MEWLVAIRARLVQRGIPEAVVLWAGMPICGLLIYGVVFGATSALGVTTVWAHALALFLIIAFPWPFLVLHFLRDPGTQRIALIVLAGLTFGLLPLLWYVHDGIGWLMPAALAALVAGLIAEVLINRRRWTPQAVRILGFVLLSSTILSLPALFKWMELPTATSPNKVGVLVAQFEGDSTGGVQAGIIGGLARELKRDVALRSIVELKQLQQPIRREPDDPLGDQRLRRALEFGRRNNASIVVFGIVTGHSKTDIVVAAVVPGVLEGQPWDVRVDTDEDTGVKLIHFLSQVIGGLTYAVLQDCMAAKALFESALKQRDVSPEAKSIGDDVHLLHARSILCAGSRGQTTSASLLEAIGAYTVLSASQNPRIATLASIGLGVAYRITSEYDDLSRNLENLESAVGAYEKAFAMAPPGFDPAALAAARSGLGVALEKLSQLKDTTANLKQALAQHDSALRLLPAEDLFEIRAGILNNRGVVLMRLADRGSDRVGNLTAAIETFSRGLLSRKSSWSRDPSLYALMKSNLGDAYIDLAQIDNMQENLVSATKELEEGLRVVTAAKQPAVFAEAIFKLGTANILLVAVRPDRQMFLTGLGQLACSLTIFDKINHNKARAAAEFLGGVGTAVNAVQFNEQLRMALPVPGCPYTGDAIPALIAKWSR
jgi:tetratricopeptide (TPR) repeat protein